MGNYIQGVLPIVFWCCKVTCEKFSKQGESSVSPFCKAGWLPDREIFGLGVGETRGAALGQCYGIMDLLNAFKTERESTATLKAVKLNKHRQN